MSRKHPHIRAFDRFRHPYVAVMITIAIACTVLTYLTEGEYSLPQTMLSFAHVSLLVGLYWYPVPCACAIIILSITIGIIPDTAFVKQFWSLWLSAGILGYCRRLWVVLSLLLIQTGSMITMTLRHPQIAEWNLTGVLSFNIICTIMVITGYALAEHREVEQLRRKAQERERLDIEQQRLRRDMVLASQIHDSTTRGLALISLLSEQCIEESTNAHLSAEMTERISRIGSTARSTLQAVRKVIDVLNQNKQDTATKTTVRTCKDDSDTGSEPFETMLTRLIADNDTSMAAVGIHGSSTISASVSSVMTVSHIDPETMQEIRNLINQMYTNIAVHGAQGTDVYHVRVELTERVLHIQEFNAIGRTDARLHSGKGLSLHRQRITSIGGALHTHREDGIWVLRAVIPIIYA